MEHMARADGRPKGFESIVLIAGSEKFRLDVRGWTPETIGASEPVYKKLYPNSDEAYYQVTLDQIQLLTEADVLELRTTGSASKNFVPWYKPAKAKDDLAAFLKTVLQ